MTRREKSLWSVIFNSLYYPVRVLRSSLKSLSHFTRECPICEKVVISLCFLVFSYYYRLKGSIIVECC